MKLTDITETFDQFDNIKPCTIICCADHGVAEENVSAYPKETTMQMVNNYILSRGAAANAFANFIDSELIVVDVGVDADVNHLPNIVNRKIARGTQNITKGAAMTLEQAMKSINIGVEIAKTAAQAGYNCFLPGEMGIANTTSTAAITSLMLNLKPDEVTGRGSNISDERLAHKIEVIKKAIEVNKITCTTEAERAMQILASVGGFEIGCIAGIIIGAHATYSLAILDGFNTSVAALIACSLVPDCRNNIIASQIAREKGHKYVLDALRLTPILDLNLALGEAIGSSIALKILEKLNFNDYYDDDYGDYEEDDEDDTPDIDYVFDDDEEDDEDDEGYDIELNIYDGESSDQRFYDNDDDDEYSIEFEKMDSSNISVTDRTFNFYLHTMPRLDKSAMERCQSHIDNLSKPYGSLGMLEEIVVQIAGISGEELPSSKLKTTLLCFTDKVDEADELEECIDNDEDTSMDNPLTDIKDTAESFNVNITFAVIQNDEDPATAFDFGRMTAEDTSFRVPIIGISISSDIANNEDISEEMMHKLLTTDNKLKYNADDFLRYVPKHRRNLVGSIIGAIIAAAHNSSLVVVDAGAVDIIARYVEKLCPEARPYILHAARLVVNGDYKQDDELDGEVVCIGIEIVRAALFAMNEMKSFKDTGVTSAIDGLGSIHQTN